MYVRQGLVPQCLSSSNHTQSHKVPWVVSSTIDSLPYFPFTCWTLLEIFKIQDKNSSAWLYYIGKINMYEIIK